MNDQAAAAEEMHVSERTPVKLPLAAWLLCAGAMAAAGASWGISQQQLAAHERRIEAISTRQAATDARAHDMRVLLERIDERTATMKQQLERMAK